MHSSFYHTLRLPPEIPGTIPLYANIPAPSSLSLINSDQISEEEKQTAIQNLIGMTEISEKENAAETLLKAKGFVDPVVSITDGKVDVVVNAASLSDQERAQIEDIVKRKTEIGADGIVITLLDAEE